MYMLQMETNLAKFAKILGKDDKKYRKAAAARKEAINTLMWNKEDGECLFLSSSNRKIDVPSLFGSKAEAHRLPSCL